MGKQKKQSFMGKAVKVTLGVTAVVGVVIGIGTVVVGSLVAKKTAKAVKHSVDNVKKEALAHVPNFCTFSYLRI